LKAISSALQTTDVQTILTTVGEPLLTNVSGWLQQPNIKHI
jgi:hypothetical protein